MGKTITIGPKSTCIEVYFCQFWCVYKFIDKCWLFRYGFFKKNARFPIFRLTTTNFFWQWDRFQREISRQVCVGYVWIFFWAIIWCFTWFVNNSCANIFWKISKNSKFHGSHHIAHWRLKVDKSLYFIISNACAKFQQNRNTRPEDDWTLCTFSVILAWHYPCINRAYRARKPAHFCIRSLISYTTLWFAQLFFFISINIPEYSFDYKS